MVIAVIDIGTNSIKLVVMRRAEILQDRMVVTRIGEGVSETGKINRKAAERTLVCIKDFLSVAKSCSAEKIVLVATEALRRANNSKVFLKQIEKLGAKAEVISGREESMLSYLGATYGGKIHNPLAVDVGGGSVEYIKRRDGRLISTSLPIGVVVLTEKFISDDPPTLVQINAMREFVKGSLGFLKKETSTVVAIGGSPAMLAFVLSGDKNFIPNKYHMSRVGIDDLNVLQDKLFGITTAERVRKYHIEKGRADVMVAGVVILQQTLCATEKNQFIVSTRGLRHGVGYKYLMDRGLL